MKDVVLWLFFVILGAVVLDIAKDGVTHGPTEEAAITDTSQPHA